MKELSRKMGRVEQFTSGGQRTHTASYNSIKWTNKVVLVVFQTQVNFKLIPTLLGAKGLSEAAWYTAPVTERDAVGVLLLLLLGVS